MHKDHKKVLSLVVPAKPEYLSLVRLVVAAAAKNEGFSDNSIADIKVALSEACTNVVRHAYLAANDDVKKVIQVKIDLDKTGFQIEVLDYGHGMALPPPPSEGLGFGIMGSLMDKVDVETSDDGTTVQMIKKVVALRNC